MHTTEGERQGTPNVTGKAQAAQGRGSLPVWHARQSLLPNERISEELLDSQALPEILLPTLAQFDRLSRIHQPAIAQLGAKLLEHLIREDQMYAKVTARV